MKSSLFHENNVFDCCKTTLLLIKAGASPIFLTTFQLVGFYTRCEQVTWHSRHKKFYVLYLSVEKNILSVNINAFNQLKI